MRARTAAALSLVLGAVLVAGCNSDKKAGANPNNDQSELTVDDPTPSAEPSPSADPNNPVLATPEPTYSPVPHFVPDANALAARKRHANFGYLTVLRDHDPVRMSFDKALFLGGNEANKAAFEHGEETPVPNDYYIVNDNKQLRTVTLSESVKVVGSLALNDYRHDTEDVSASKPASLKDLLGFLRTERARSTGFNLTLDKAGLVVRVEEQYQP